MTTAPRRQAASGGVFDPLLLVIWLRLVPDAVKLRRSNLHRHEFG